MSFELSLDEPVLIAVSKQLLTEFGIHHRLERSLGMLCLPVNGNGCFKVGSALLD